jgi:hypothetical protein
LEITNKENAMMNMHDPEDDDDTGGNEWGAA